MKYVNYKIWIIAVITVLITTTLVANYIESVYVEIIINSLVALLCAIATHIQQSDYTEKARKRELKQSNYDTTEALVFKIKSALNIYRNFEYFIYTLDPNKDVRGTIGDIVKLQDAIDITITEFNIHKIKIDSHQELLQYEQRVNKIVSAYNLVFDGFKSEVIDKLNDLQNSADVASYAAEQIGSKNDKLNMIIGLEQKRTYIKQRKEVFLNLLKAQETNINKMLSELGEAQDKLLQAEYELIDK